MNSDGFQTTVLPARSAGTIYQDGTAVGKFPAVIINTLPTGILKVNRFLFCISLGTLWIHESIYDSVLAKFTALVENAAVGDPFKDVLFGPMISEKYLENHLDHLKMIQPHHKVSGSTATGKITAKNPRKGFVGDPEKGVFAHPVIVAGVTKDDELYRTETFGPLVTVGKFSTLDEAIELANGHGYGLIKD